MFTIRQQGDQWELVGASGEVLSTHSTYDVALGELASMLEAMLAVDTTAPDNDGLLPEVWFSEMCFSEDTGDGRNFTEVTWSSRDPNVSTMPLMLQTETEYGHFGACLAGYITEVTLGPSPTGRGRFYASEAGVAARDMLLGDRRFGVSVDPGAVMAEYICTSMDEDGWCEEGEIRFDEYEIIGLTMTPFPGFAAAFIALDAVEPVVEPEPAAGNVAASATAVSERPVRAAHAARTRPPRERFDDPAFELPTPLTITDDGNFVLGHIAAWGTCHVGEERMCITPPTSQLNYARFTKPGLLCSNGERVSTGALTWGIPHADLTLDMIRAQAHYADTRHGWADVAVGEDDHGIWISGRVRPHVTDDELSVLAALALSGDWRRDREVGGLELVAALAVNVPGFPIPQAVTASGRSIAQPVMRAGIGSGMEQLALVASGIVVPTQFAQLARSGCGCSGSSSAKDAAWRAEVMRVLGRLDRRTKHLTGDAIEHLATRLALEPLDAAMPPASYVPRSR